MAADEAETCKQTDRQPASSSTSAAPKIRGRRKPAPNIPVCSRQRQHHAPSDKADKAKETGTEKSQLDQSDEADVAERRVEGAVAEPPPVRRVVERPDVTSTGGKLVVGVIPEVFEPMPKPADSTEPRQPSSNSSQSQSLPIHQDAPPVSNKTPATVTKATTTVTKTTTAKSGSTPLRTIGPPEKKNPMNIYERKLRELKETLEEEPKRRRRYVKKNMPSDRSNMTMSDLIYYNPKTNPMKQSSPGAENKERRRTSLEIVTDLSRDGSGGDDNENDDDKAIDQFAPQVKIGPDGELILDQKSLVKDASPRKTFDVSDSEVVHEEFSNTTYASFRKQTRTAMWTEKETEKFYKALSAVGTDFSIINAMFPKRTRQQIKNKFKREEKRNRHKVDAAIRKTSKVSMSMFEHSDEDSESETENRLTKAASTKSQKCRASGKSASAQKPTEAASVADEAEDTPVSGNEGNVSDEEEMVQSENGDAVPGSLPPPAGKEASESEEDIDMETILGRPTRSGRQPKMRTSFTIEEEPSTRVHARSKGAIRANLEKRTQAVPNNEPQIETVPNDQPQHENQQHQGQATLQTPSAQTFVVPTTNPRTPPHQGQKVTSVEHIIINLPVVQATTQIVPNPSPIKTHIYVINSPDGSQRIIQLPSGSNIPTHVQGNPTSPIVIHKVQASQSESVQSTPVASTVNAQNNVVIAQSARAPSHTVKIVPIQTPTSSAQSVTTASSLQGDIQIVPLQSGVEQTVKSQSVIASSQIATGPSQSTVPPVRGSIHIVPIQGGLPQTAKSPRLEAPSEIVSLPSQSTEVSSQSGVHKEATQSAAPHKTELQEQKYATLNLAVQSDATLTATSPVAKSEVVTSFPTKPLIVGLPPKLQQKPYVAQKYTIVDVVQQPAGGFVQQQQQQEDDAQVPVTMSSASSECVFLQEYVQDSISDTSVALEVDVECLDRMSDTASESGAFIPPVAGAKNRVGAELTITGLGSESLSTRDIFEQISYEQGAAAVPENEAVAANSMAVQWINSDMIQIASEIATEK